MPRRNQDDQSEINAFLETQISCSTDSTIIDTNDLEEGIIKDTHKLLQRTKRCASFLNHNSEGFQGDNFFSSETMANLII